MLDLSLSLVEAADSLVVHACCEGLGEASAVVSREDCASLGEIRLRADEIMKARASDRELGELGKRLFGLLFQEDVRDIYQRACAVSEDPLRGPLLILLKMAPDSRLQEVPWEILHDGRRALTRDPRVSVVRYFNQPVPVDRLEVQPPLQVLLTTANPVDLTPLELDKEVELIRLAYKEAGPLVDLKVAEGVCLGQLEAIWRRARAQARPFHVWHHCGHGGVTRNGEKKSFTLYLEKNQMKEPVPVETLQDVVSFCPELRVAILNVCRAGSEAGLVPALARLRVPVVVGFQHSVNDHSALRFATALHRELLYMPIELAVNDARRSVKINHPETLDWNHALVISRRKDRGGLIKRLQKGTAAQKQGAGKPKPKRPSTSVDIKIGNVKADNFQLIGTQTVGKGAPRPAQDTKVKMSIDQIEAIRIRQIGYQALEGFSDEQIRRREEKLVQLMKTVDGYLAERT